ncbi:MAG TPA: hypothetical protein VL326_23650 [Kofleriaceae bacterium]|nr:hypothetical protein [Kofleriaceae bacterium]
MRGAWLVVVCVAACSREVQHHANDASADAIDIDAPVDAPPDVAIDAKQYLDAPSCGATPIACPAPTSATKVTICGQLYDFANNTKLVGPATAVCDPQNPAASGPCALTLTAFDGVAFAANPSTATPLAVDSVTIDECGRFRVAGIETNGTGPFIGLVIDDAGIPMGPAGTAVPVLVFAPKIAVIEGTEAWLVSLTTTNSWANTNGPALSNGVYAGVFRKHRAGNGDPLEPQPGVRITKNGSVISGARYFTAAETDHLTIDMNATVTGANGTVLVTGTSISDSVVYGGDQGLGTGCRWQSNPAANLPGIVFIEIFHKLDAIGETCAD